MQAQIYLCLQIDLIHFGIIELRLDVQRFQDLKFKEFAKILRKAGRCGIVDLTDESAKKKYY